MKSQKKIVTLKLNSDLHEQLRQHAKDRGLPMTKYTTLAIRMMLSLDDEEGRFFTENGNCGNERIRNYLKEDYDSYVKTRENMRQNKIKMTERQMKKRKAEHANWRETDDETTLLLRSAYDNGIRFSYISNMSGVKRGSLYFYLNGERICPDEYREPIKAAVETLMSEKAASEN